MHDFPPDAFGPNITTDDLSQSDPRHRDKLRRSCRQAYLLATSACIGLSASTGLNIIDSGHNLHHLGPPITATPDSFDPFATNAHILETEIESNHDDLTRDALMRKMHLQFLDTFEDARDGFSFTPTEVVAHRVSTLPRRVIPNAQNPKDVTLTRSKHLRVKTFWQNGEVSWVSAHALREQHPWTLVNYAV